MKTYKLNLTFENHEQVQKWIDENIIDRKYNGEPIMMLCHEQTATGEEKITEIITIG